MPDEIDGCCGLREEAKVFVGQSGPAGRWGKFEGGGRKVKGCKEDVEGGQFGNEFSLGGDGGYRLGHSCVGV